MLLWIFRVLVIILTLSVLWIYALTAEMTEPSGSTSFWATVVGAIVLVSIAFLVDVLTPKKSLGALAGVFFGLLVGILISWVLSPVVVMLDDIWKLNLKPDAIQAIKLTLGICVCYLVITIVVRTKDDVRFIIPYVEFAKQVKGARPLVLDTSAIIDGRIADLYRSKLFDAPLLVPRFVLNELQLIADSADRLKRNRGRRGLDILKEMQMNPLIDIEIDETPTPDTEGVEGVDQKLVVFTKNINGRLATTDYNLSKVAQVREVDVMNINDLANSLKTIALPGEALSVKIVKPGEEADQGIGYLDDGTMVVVESGRNKIGRDVNISITSSLQTSAGKMIFGKFESFAQKSDSGRARLAEKSV